MGLTDGLSVSRYLIVICSENATKPGREGKDWVDAEVRAFLELDEENRNYVIPVLLRKKGGASSKECTPPSVQELNLLAADVSDKGEERVFNDVAAKMLGLEPGELWDWWEREKRFRRRCWRTIGTVAAFLAAYAGWAAWDYYAPHYSYYADYVECNNIPQGIHSLNHAETEHLASYYRFTTQRHRLILVETCNAAGEPVLTSHLPGHEERPVALELDYSRETGRAKLQFYYNAAMQKVQIREVGNKTISFRVPASGDDANGTPGVGSASFTLAPGVEIAAENSNVELLKVERDPERGFIVREQYSNIHNVGVLANKAGVCGRSYERELQYGRPTKVVYEDKDKKPTADNIGVVSICYDYLPDGGPVCRVTYRGMDDAPVAGPRGYAVAEYEWQNGNLQKTSYYDAQGKPMNL